MTREQLDFHLVAYMKYNDLDRVSIIGNKALMGDVEYHIELNTNQVRTVRNHNHI